MIGVYIFHNLNRFAKDPLRGLKEGDDLRLVYHFDVLPRESVSLLERVFSLLNSDPPRDYQYRSLSVGDVVTLVESTGPNARVSYELRDQGWEALKKPVVNGGKWGAYGSANDQSQTGSA